MIRLLGVCLLTVVTGLVQAAEKPNVVIVITDDQGYGDLSCHGNPKLKTPKIDELFAESVRLKDYHVAPTCSPTRCAFLTGHWTNRTGVWHTIMGRSMLRENEVTMGQVFKTPATRRECLVNGIWATTILIVPKTVDLRKSCVMAAVV